MNKYITWKSRLLAILLLITLSVGGCTRSPLGPESVPLSETAPLRTAGPEEQKQQAAAEQQRFDSLIDELFRKEVRSSQILLHFSLKDPQAYGITDSENGFDDYSVASQKEAVAEQKDLMKQLNSFNSQLLTAEQKKTYFILQKYLEIELMADGMELYAQPLSTTIGVQAQLPILLAEYYFDRKQDVEDYLALLAEIDDYFAQLLVFEQQKAEAGLMHSDRTIDHIISSCESYLLVPGDNFMIETFDNRLSQVPGLTEAETADYSARNRALLESDFVPAYQNLIDGLAALKGTGINDEGLSHLPDGKRYYEYLVASATGTSYETMEDLLEAMEIQLTNDLIAVTAIVQEHPELAEQIAGYSFRLSDPVEILEDLKGQTTKDFPELRECNYDIKYVPQALELTLSPAFYLSPPVDDAMNNSIYINGRSMAMGDDGGDNSMLYTTLAHEGYPGHLYQSVYFNSANAPEIRHLLSFVGYSEGWASYVERYSYSLDNGLDPNLGELLAANTYASLGLQAILDIYINYYGWDIKTVQKFLSSFYQNPDMEVVQSIYDAMVENPSNYLSYYVGYLEMENMRQDAQTELNDQFDLKKYHTFILDMGPAPYSVIRKYFDAWVAAQKS